ncbi:hypothetical protein [Achromobacter sp.]|nr:hypothetical protein [Achromobacter sp.]
MIEHAGLNQLNAAADGRRVWRLLRTALVGHTEAKPMLQDELLAKMIVKTAPCRRFDDWAEVLTEFASCLVQISPRLSPEECDRLINIGASFYRTLARAEDYRRTSIHGD